MDEVFAAGVVVLGAFSSGRSEDNTSFVTPRVAAVARVLWFWCRRTGSCAGGRVSTSSMRFLSCRKLSESS